MRLMVLQPELLVNSAFRVLLRSRLVISSLRLDNAFHGKQDPLQFLVVPAGLVKAREEEVSSSGE